jgi:hypothetical protein
MANRAQKRDDSLNLFLAPALGRGALNPLLIGVLKGSAEANEGFAALADEWYRFVGRRLKEDIALMQHLGDSRMPDQVMTVYTEFWHKAVEDYGNEITTMSKLMNRVATTVVATAQSASDGASEDMSRPRRAA